MKQLRILCSTLCAASLLLVSACSHVPDAGHFVEAREQISRVDRHGAFPGVRRIYFEQVNLVELIDPHGIASTRFREAWKQTDDLQDERKWGVRYDLVLASFREDSVPEQQKIQHRNSVQDKILAVATSRCNVFKTFLRRQQTDVNFMLGSATTAAGVLGAVLQGVNSSRNLAGAAGLFSGIQAEYNQAYYNNLTAHVIVQGIEQLQARLQKGLVEGRKDLPLNAYSMEAAINDAIFIDGSCSTVAGLLEASDSIKQVSSPGLIFAAQVIASTKALREIEQGNISELMSTGKLDQLLKRASPANPPLIATLSKKDASSTALGAVSSAASAKTRIAEIVLLAEKDLAGSFTSAQKKLDQSTRKLKSDAEIDTRANEVKVLFRAAETNAIGSLPVEACVAALEQPTSQLGAAQAKQLLAGADETKKARARQDLEVATANAVAAAARVELLVSAIQQGTERNARRWENLFVGDAPVDADLQKAFLASDFNAGGFTDLCK